jgi:hypothetical protein
MTATDEALKQLDALLNEHAEYELRLHNGQATTVETLTITNRLLAAVERFTAPNTTYGQGAVQQRNSTKPSQWRLYELAALATALRDDIRNGWLTSVVELAHADTYADYLSMAEGLQAQGYKDPAAVIAGTSLEVQLKALATKQGIDLLMPNGRPKMASALNDDLKREGVYNALEHKQVIAWLAIRNSAAHGNYGDYDEAAVKGLIEGVGNFAIKYPA